MSSPVLELNGWKRCRRDIKGIVNWEEDEEDKKGGKKRKRELHQHLG